MGTRKRGKLQLGTRRCGFTWPLVNQLEIIDSSSSASATDTHSDTDAVIRPPPRHKRSRHTTSKWQVTWTKYRLKARATYAYCTVCSCDFSVGGDGVCQASLQKYEAHKLTEGC